MTFTLTLQLFSLTIDKHYCGTMTQPESLQSAKAKHLHCKSHKKAHLNLSNRQGHKKRLKQRVMCTGMIVNFRLHNN